MESQVQAVPNNFKEVIASLIYSNTKPLTIGEISHNSKSFGIGLNSPAIRDGISWIMSVAPEYIEVIPETEEIAEKYRIKVSGAPEVIVSDIKMKAGIPMKDTPAERSKIRALKIIRYMAESGVSLSAKEMAEWANSEPDAGYGLKNKILIVGNNYFLIHKEDRADKYQWNPENTITPEEFIAMAYPSKREKAEKKEESGGRKIFPNEEILNIIKKEPLTMKELMKKTGRGKGSIEGKLYRMKEEGIIIKIGQDATGNRTFFYDNSSIIEEDVNLKGLGERRKIDRSLSKPEQTARDLILRIKDIKCVNAYRKVGKSTYTFDRDYRGLEIESWTNSRNQWLETELNDIFRSVFIGIETPIHGIATIEYEAATINIIYSERGNHVMTITWNR